MTGSKVFVMSNRITHEFNNILNASEDIMSFFSKDYLFNKDFVINSKSADFIDKLNMYYRISGYELYQDEEKNKERINSVSRQMLTLAHSSDMPVSLTVFSDGKENKLFIGSNYTCAEKIKNILKNNLSALKISNEWIRPVDLNSIQNYSGCVVGLSTLDVSSLDKILSALKNKKFMFSFVMIPVEHYDIENELSNINNLIESLQKVRKNEIVIGSNRARNYESDNQQIINVLELLDKEKEKIKDGLISGMWYTFVQVSAPSEQEYRDISSALVAAFRECGRKENQISRATAYDVSYNIIDKTNWRIPNLFLGKRIFGEMHRNSFLNVSNLFEASSMLALPQKSHDGYLVRHFGESALSIGAIDNISVRKIEDGDFELGKIENGDSLYADVNSMRQHVFVTGTTQYGKSTTVRKLLWEAKQRNVQFVVIEAAKKDYWKMVNYKGMEGIKVYSSGDDALDLRINPFQPEDDVILDNHIQNIIQAFLSLFDGEDPIPQILSDLVYLCYEKKGWITTKRANEQIDLEYPVLSDMLLNLDECINSIGYGEETRNNMRGVLKIRLSSLIRQAGKAFDTKDNISMREMFNNSAIIELEDFSEINKPFVASILAIKAGEYSKQMAMGNSIKRILVLEEAHHIIPNVELRTATKSSIKCSTYFSNMLAEISAYGTGVVIVDQRPSQVSSAVLANTAMKVIHNLREREDIDIIINSLLLEEGGMVNKLEIGEALVTLPQTHMINRVRINGKIEKSGFTTISKVFNSNINKRDLPIDDFEKKVISTYGYNADSLKRCLRFLEDKEGKIFNKTERLVAVGELSKLLNDDENDLKIRRVIYETIS